MSGDSKTNFRPSRAALNEISFSGSSPMRTGRPLTPRISSSAVMTQPNDNALTMYTQPTPAEAITMPPIEGPSTDAV